jgi:hypothetical protein
MTVGLLLIALGLALSAVTAWFWRSARLDNPVLGPLEVMGDKQFVAADAATRKEMLRKARTTVEP